MRCPEKYGIIINLYRPKEQTSKPDLTALSSFAEHTMERFTMNYVTSSPAETEALGEKLGKIVPAGAVIAYTGDLGAGKTAFTRGLARGLGLTDRVTSPTFTIVNEYEGGRLPLFHFDMYRLGSSDELYDIGWEDYLSRDGVCAVEWSEIVDDALEEDAIRVDIRRGASDSQRIISITGAEGL